MLVLTRKFAGAGACLIEQLTVTAGAKAMFFPNREEDFWRSSWRSPSHPWSHSRRQPRALRAKRKRHPPSAERAIPKQLVQDQDEFRFCDVAVREFIQGRKEATALPVKEVKVDVLRMTLNFVHPYGESGETAPNLGFTRAESVEERRKALN